MYSLSGHTHCHPTIEGHCLTSSNPSSGALAQSLTDLDVKSVSSSSAGVLSHSENLTSRLAELLAWSSICLCVGTAVLCASDKLILIQIQCDFCQGAMQRRQAYLCTSSQKCRLSSVLEHY